MEGKNKAISRQNLPPDDNTKGQILLTLQELELYDGRDGSPAYIAANGIIYDVTPFPQWAQGVHFGVSAGQDVSARVQLCHGGHILELLRVVGRII